MGSGMCVSEREKDLRAQIEAEDKLDIKRERRKSRHAEQNRLALEYVKDYVFAFCPIEIEPVKQNGKVNELITLSRVSLEEQRKHHLVGFPDTAVVEFDGTIVIRKGENVTTTITPEMLKASRSAPPPKPKSPVLHEATNSSIEVVWERVLGLIVNRFEVQYRLCHRMAVFKCLYVGKAISAKLTNLAHAKWFEFRVRMEGPCGWSHWSDISTPFRTSPMPPDPPHEPVSGTKTWQSLEILWNTPNDNGDEIVSYEVQSRRFRTDVSSPQRRGIDAWRTFKNIIPAQRYLLIDRLVPSTDFEIRVRAHSKAGPGTWSPSAIVKTSARSADADLVLLRETNSWQEHYNTMTGRIVYMKKRTLVQYSNPPNGFLEELDRMDNRARREAEEKREENMIKLFRTKRFRFVLALHKELKRRRGEAPYELRVKRSSRIFEDTMIQFDYSTVMRKRLNVIYEDEMGVDAGGLTKDLFVELSKAMLSPERKLFRKVRVSEGSHFAYIFDDTSPIAQLGGDTSEARHRLSEWYFCGALVAKALIERVLMHIPLCPSIWHHIVGHSVGMNELSFENAELAKSLNWMKDHSVDNILFETFSVSRAGRGEVVPLIPGGDAVSVTDRNKSEYIDLVVAWHLRHKYEAALNAFMSGFNSAVSPGLVRVFSADELERLVNGDHLVSSEKLREHCLYSGGFTPTCELIEWFWLLVESMSKDERGLLLRFVTGSPKMPLDGFDPNFNIELDSHADPESLPRAHTCFNQLVLPPYTEFVKLQSKVYQAIEYGAGGFHLE